MPAKCMRLPLVALALVAIISMARADTQEAATVERYRDAVETYARTGDVAAAVKPLTGWNKEQLDLAVKAVISRADSAELESAAVLQLEIGTALAGSDPAGAEGYLALGSRMIDALLPPSSIRAGLSAQRLSEIATVRATWLGVAGSVLLSVNEIETARPYFEKALRITPKSAALLTMLGASFEIDGTVYNPDDIEAAFLKNRARAQRSRLLLRAQLTYREALKVDPDYPLAQIRLGRVRFLNDDLKQAGEWLAKGSAGAREPAHRYLAAMFTGALLQQKKDLAGAREAFERALAVAPRSQSAMVGLAYVEMMAGRPDRAQTLVRGHIAEANADDSWWAFKNGTLDQDGLQWLRARVRK